MELSKLPSTTMQGSVLLLFQQATSTVMAGQTSPLSTLTPTFRCYWVTAMARSKPLSITARDRSRSEEHTSELQSQSNLVCRLLLEKKKNLIKDRAMSHKMSART